MSRCLALSVLLVVPIISYASTCVQQVGVDLAQRYVDECVYVSPATHPPCNSLNSCDLIVDEIKRGCEFIENDQPIFCKFYTEKISLEKFTDRPVSKVCSTSESEASLKTCLTNAVTAAENKLQEIYKGVLNRAKRTDEPLTTDGTNDHFIERGFSKSHMAWLKFRDEECAFISIRAADAVKDLIVADCKVALTSDRIRWLNYYLTCNIGESSDCFLQ